MKYLKSALPYIGLCFIAIFSFQNCGGQFSAVPSERSISSANLGSESFYNTYTISSQENLKMALQSAIDTSIKTGRTSLIKLAAGTYNLSCLNSLGSYCFSIVQAHGLKIQGVPGQTHLLIDGPLSGAFLIMNSSEITIAGISIDYKVPPFSQGKVLSVEPYAMTYLTDEGFPEPLDPRVFTVCEPNAICERAGHVFDSSGTTSKSHALGDYVSISGDPQNMGSGKWKINSYNDLTTFVAVGDRVAINQRSTQAIVGLSSANLTFSQVQVYSAPQMGFVFVDTSGVIDLDRIEVKPLAGSGRILSANADAIHVMNSRAQVLIHGSQITNMGDDALNIKVEGLPVISKAGEELELPKYSTIQWRVGDAIQFTDPTRNILRLNSNEGAIITKVTDGTNSVKVLLDRPISSVQAQDFAFNTNAASPNSILDGNQFGSYRGSLRLRSPNAIVRNNTFTDANTARILFSIDSYWNEGPMTNPPQLQGNTVINGNLKLYGLNWLLIP